MSRFKTVSIGLLLVICLTLVRAFSASGAECAVGIYNSAEFKENRTVFSPYEKVFVKIFCNQIVAGQHIMHANWVHKKRGMIRSDTHTFKMDIPGERFIFFWFKLTKRGPFSSAFTNEDFHGENFGEWLVDVYLDDVFVGAENFEILPEGSR